MCAETEDVTADVTVEKVGDDGHTVRLRLDFGKEVTLKKLNLVVANIRLVNAFNDNDEFLATVNYAVS